MIIFPDYVASFTSKYTYQAACKKIVENKAEYEKELSLNEKAPDADSVRLQFTSKKSLSPELEVVIKEKTEGALVYARMNAKKPMKAFAWGLIFIFACTLIFLFACAFGGKISFAIPVLFVPFSMVISMLVERLWAKKCCIKTYRLICNALDYKPEKVTIIKVLKKFN